LALLKPDGSTLSSNSSLSTTTFLDAVTLPVDGTYTVLVDPDGTRTGSFTLTVYTMTDVTGTVTANGSPTTFSLSTPGQNARYSLAGTAGQRVSVLISNATCCGSSGTLAILKPDGSTLAANNSLSTTTFLASVFHEVRWRGVGGCLAVWMAPWDGCGRWPARAGAAGPGRGTQRAVGGHLGVTPGGWRVVDAGWWRR
jgi:hypothetical protein